MRNNHQLFVYEKKNARLLYIYYSSLKYFPSWLEFICKGINKQIIKKQICKKKTDVNLYHRLICPLQNRNNQIKSNQDIFDSGRTSLSSRGLQLGGGYIRCLKSVFSERLFHHQYIRVDCSKALECFVISPKTLFMQLWLPIFMLSQDSVMLLITFNIACCSSGGPGKPARGEAGQAQCGSLHLLQEDWHLFHFMAQPGAAGARRHRLLDRQHKVWCRFVWVSLFTSSNQYSYLLYSFQSNINCQCQTNMVNMVNMIPA